MDVSSPSSGFSFDSNSSSSSSMATTDIMPDVRLANVSDNMSSNNNKNDNNDFTRFQYDMGFQERALSAAGAAFLSAIIVNPLDVVKTRLQAQAAGANNAPETESSFFHRRYYGPRMATIAGPTVYDQVKCPPACPRGGAFGLTPLCPPSCFEYKGTFDVFYKIIRQEGFSRLWRGTNAGLALAVPTVGIYLPCYDIFRDWLEDFCKNNAPQLTPYAPLLAGSVARSLACITCSPLELARTRMQAQKLVQTGVKPPGMWKTLVDVMASVRRGSVERNYRSFPVLWAGVGAQLARDVPFSAICWTTLEPIRRRLLNVVGDDANAATILGANFSAAFVAGSISAAATCPLDVAKTRRQIEKDPMKAMKTSTLQTLKNVWREGGIRSLFTGVGPRVGRAGPSVGIVVSFYEVVKHLLHQSHVQ